MKMVLATMVILSFGFVNAEEAGKTVSKDEKKAMHEAIKEERDAVNTACMAEAKEAGCSDKVVGKGLLKCIHEHKKASKEFKVSDGCKTAMKSLREERKKIKK